MIISLMKILPCKEYVEYFLDGKLYCNTVRYFRDKGYDEFEGAAFLHPTTLRIGSHTVPEEDLVGPAILTPNLVADLNVFCMFSWRAPKVGDDAILIDLESQLGSIAACIAEFGTYTVVVKNTTEFLRRVELAAVRGGVLSTRAWPRSIHQPGYFPNEPRRTLENPALQTGTTCPPEGIPIRLPNRPRTRRSSRTAHRAACGESRGSGLAPA